jgi:dienelactone hydrolase
MCHPDAPDGQATPEVAREEVEIPLASGESMPALLTRPSHAPAPSVLIASDMFGRSPFYEHLAALLAQEGFEALVPDYFFRVGGLTEHSHEAAFARRRQLDEGRSVDDLRDALGWLRERPGAPARVGTLGFCMGGTFVLDLAALESNLVTVAYYGFPRPQGALASPPPAPMDLVDEIQGPLLAFWGDQDQFVGMDNVQEFAGRLSARGIDFQHEVYPGLGHGFLAAGLGSAGPADAQAAASWALAVGHLRRHLL